MQRYRYIWHLQIQIHLQIQLELVLLTCGTFVGHESRKAALAEAIEYRVERLATCLYLGRILGLSAAGGQREQQRAQQRQQQQQLLLLSVLEHCNRLERERERDVCVCGGCVLCPLGGCTGCVAISGCGKRFYISPAAAAAHMSLVISILNPLQSLGDRLDTETCVCACSQWPY